MEEMIIYLPKLYNKHAEHLIIVTNITDTCYEIAEPQGWTHPGSSEYYELNDNEWEVYVSDGYKKRLINFSKMTEVYRDYIEQYVYDNYNPEEGY